MQGLHNIRTPAPKRAIRWYAAHRTRRGMRHLIEVPVVDIDLMAWLGDANQRRMLPYNLRYANREEQERYVQAAMRDRRNLAIPYNVNFRQQNDHEVTHSATILCTDEVEEDVRYYELMHHGSFRAGALRPRGFCGRCWSLVMSFNASLAETPQATAIGYLQFEEERWRDTARRDFRPH